MIVLFVYYTSPNIQKYTNIATLRGVKVSLRDAKDTLRAYIATLRDVRGALRAFIGNLISVICAFNDVLLSLLSIKSYAKDS
jgi:hypothetical protein